MLTTTIPDLSRPVISMVQRSLAALPGLAVHYDPVAAEFKRGNYLRATIERNLAGEYPLPAICGQRITLAGRDRPRPVPALMARK